LREGAELLGSKRALQFVGNFDERHGWIIASLWIGLAGDGFIGDI
jgi:hypothetical protein